MKNLSKQEWIAVSVAVVGAFILFFGNTVWNYVTGAATQSRTDAQPETGLSAGTTTPNQITVENTSKIAGLEIYELKLGDGAEAIPGKTVVAHYVGTFPDGTKFDSSLDRGTPIDFVLGSGRVIKGWDQGLVGMKVGGIRALVVSPELGYGKNAIGSIPANSTLVFQVQLLEVK